MIERSVQLDGSGSNSSTKRAVRPTDLPTENRQRRMRHGKHSDDRKIVFRSHSSVVLVSLAAQSFPTPMEEPKKILRAQYLGCSEVQQAVGMNTINDAIEKIGAEAAPEHWTSVNVSISPSMIAVRPSGVSFPTSFVTENRFSFSKKSITGR
jgi:amyloid beta A4 precursor protein-binding family B member 2